VRVKEGVEFKVIAPGGFRILAALDHTAVFISHDLTITSGTDGEHSGPNDPHHKGEGYDIRSHDLPDKQLALSMLTGFLGSEFYAFLEDPDSENEHIHCQVAKGTIYPPES
jgi:hypothetical protein